MELHYVGFVKIDPETLPNLYHLKICRIETLNEIPMLPSVQSLYLNGYLLPGALYYYGANFPSVHTLTIKHIPGWHNHFRHLDRFLHLKHLTINLKRMFMERLCHTSVPFMELETLHIIQPNHSILNQLGDWNLPHLQTITATCTPTGYVSEEPNLKHYYIVNKLYIVGGRYNMLLAKTSSCVDGARIRD